MQRQGQNVLKKFALNSSTPIKTKKLILLATRFPEPNNDDERYLMDIDSSILGQPK